MYLTESILLREPSCSLSRAAGSARPISLGHGERSVDKEGRQAEGGLATPLPEHHPPASSEYPKINSEPFNASPRAAEGKALRGRNLEPGDKGPRGHKG